MVRTWYNKKSKADKEEAGMPFEQGLFTEYKRIMETTNVQKCYQQVLKLIRFISSELEKELPEYTFMGRVVENQMDFSYFQATRERLKALGLKVQVVFVHSSCEFEVWISGYNRKIQCSHHKRLLATGCPFALCADPERNDFILKAAVEKTITDDTPEEIVAEIKTKIAKLEAYMQEHQTREPAER